MKTRVLLINPPSSRSQFIGDDNYFPLGLLCLGAKLMEDNIEVKILDINNLFFAQEFSRDLLVNYIENDLYSYIASYRPSTIGIGCIFSGAFRYLKVIAQKIKTKFPDIPLVVGGIHPTIFPEQIIKKCQYIDYVIIGEGEKTFSDLVKYLAGRKVPRNSIDGIVYRDGSRLKVVQKEKFINDLDSVLSPNYGLIDVNEYRMDTSGWYSPHRIKVGQPFPIISSRSCPNRCTFCSMWLVHGPKIRFRSPENVLGEMNYLYHNYGVRYFQFMDDNFTFDKERTLDICNGILKRNMNIQFDTPNGLAINRLDREIIDALVEAGMVRISLAIESGSEYIRNDVMKKGLKTEKIFNVFDACAKHNHLFINGFFIIGTPQETHQTLEDTFYIIRKLPLDKYALSYATPYPGTELFKFCAINNLLKFEVDEYVDIEDLQGRSDMPHFKPFNLSIADLVEFKQKADNFMLEKRRLSKLPNNYPLRYKSIE
jgi:anaerobic magnesium-protoporphyrin IX monomethyl ester cyclase